MTTTKAKLKSKTKKIVRKPLKKTVTKLTVVRAKKLTVKRAPAKSAAKKSLVRKSVVRKSAPKAKAIHKTVAPKSKRSAGVRLTKRIQTAEGRRRAMKRKSLVKS